MNHIDRLHKASTQTHSRPPAHRALRKPFDLFTDPFSLWRTTMFNKSTLLTASMSLGLCLGASHTASAAIVLDFTQTSGTFGEDTYSLTELTDGTPVESASVDLNSRTEPTGSLTNPDVANSDTISFFYQQFNTSTLSGSDLLLQDIDRSALASNANGIASADGDILADRGQGIYFAFDLSELGTNLTNLRITAATATGNAAGNLQFVVASSPTLADPNVGLSFDDFEFSNAVAYNVGASDGIEKTGLSVDIADGDYLVVRNTGSNSFRLTDITFEAVTIPEPGSLALLGLGGLLIAKRRRD